MSGQPDPKPERRPRRAIRHVDRSAGKRVLLVQDACAACGERASNAHHVVPRGAPYFGDDVPENLLPLCGSGTIGCHGDYHAGDLETRTAIGAAIADRTDIIWYVLGKLGDEAGRDFLRRRYFMEV